MKIVTKVAAATLSLTIVYTMVVQSQPRTISMRAELGVLQRDAQSMCDAGADIPHGHPMSAMLGLEAAAERSRYACQLPPLLTRLRVCSYLPWHGARMYCGSGYIEEMDRIVEAGGL